ncbi:endonuclease domain-containing protein [Streptomyces kronopolitis]|uniref:endonuclease domain-containing protein n=1 Tax=Streptomyces kronopolitis TaxID=1612435 RepID=UPI003680C220
MQRRGQPLTSLVLRTPADAGRQLIDRGVYWCTSCQQELPLSRFGTDAGRGGLPRGNCKLCQGIVTRANKHKRTFLDVYLLFEYQRYKCAVCPVRHADGDGLHLDHDHTCCPGKGESCGQCIRGLLCWGCNGGVLPWYERIRGQEPPYPPLESYLNDPPAAALGLTKHASGSA